MTEIAEPKRKPVCYIAGPFRAGNDYARKLNRDRAEALAFAVWRLGAVALCPHMNTANFDGALPDDVWLPGDIELLRRCDAIVMVDGWERSKGAVAEHKLALQWGMRVFYEDPRQLTPVTQLNNEYAFHQWVQTWEPRDLVHPEGSPVGWGGDHLG